jgi:chromosome partitioning protein
MNYKGGVGKTTITANLGAELAKRGWKVLLIDLDPQSNLTFSFITAEEWARKFAETKTIKTWFESFEENQIIDLTEVIFSPAKVNSRLGELGYQGHIEMIASHLHLMDIDLRLATRLGGTSLQDSMRNFLKIHSRLAEGIRQTEERGYDLVLIDCPPNFNIVTKTAIVASGHILIPSKADYLSTLGIDYLQKSFHALIRDYNDYVKFGGEKVTYKPISTLILGVIFNMIQIRDGKPIFVLQEYINKVKKLKVPVFDSYLRENKTMFSDAPVSGVPATLQGYPKTGTYADIIGEIKGFADEFERKLGVKIR